MLALKVEIDGQYVVTAGVEDWSILALHVNGSRGYPGASFASGRSDSVHFAIGGLSQRDDSGTAHHFRWPEKDLAVGSTVVVTVIETDHPDLPIKRFRSDAEVQEDPFTDEEAKEMRYQDYLELKKKFEGDGA